MIYILQNSRILHTSTAPDFLQLYYMSNSHLNLAEHNEISYLDSNSVHPTHI